MLRWNSLLLTGKLANNFLTMTVVPILRAVFSSFINKPVRSKVKRVATASFFVLVSIVKFPKEQSELSASPLKPNVVKDWRSWNSANFEVWCLSAKTYNIVEHKRTHTISFNVTEYHNESCISIKIYQINSQTQVHTVKPLQIYSLALKILNASPMLDVKCSNCLSSSPPFIANDDMARMHKSSPGFKLRTKDAFLHICI